MKDGQVAEYDSPTVLMENESTIFHSLCKDAKLCWLLLCSAKGWCDEFETHIE